jgi:hypothetical protein
MDFLAAAEVAVARGVPRDKAQLARAMLADLETAEAAAAAVRGVRELHRPQASMAMATPTAFHLMEAVGTPRQSQGLRRSTLAEGHASLAVRTQLQCQERGGAPDHTPDGMAWSSLLIKGRR